MMPAILNMFAKSPAPGSVNGDKESRGMKRKAKGDPYDEIDDDEPVQKTPSNLRTRSRISSEAPSSSIKARPSSIGKPNKRRSRSLGVRKDDTVDGSRANASENNTRSRETQATRLQRQHEEEYTKSSLVPVADMGLPESSTDNNISTTSNDPAKESKDESRSVDKIHDAGNEKGTAKATQLDDAEKERTEVDEREEHEVYSLLEHRMASDGSGKVELLVHWAGEEEDEATWELEEEIQRGAGETLYTYWKAQGGRINALFIKPKNAPPETYHVFKILGHEKKTRGGFEFEVQWVGHPPTRGETSVEAEPKLRKIAPEALHQYWESVGGREKFLAKRGRNKKARTE
ncbi:uncharacterized protein F4807DRAFT_358373 [Annulohypoxylon truncatum]|uniref:uncharacterized protein n=1 Tax=Annulohypoxylon truncatum TaxID=327061 RepID=UPI002007294E|nr:uncharacterized protein F4807DRAFT_358373 [Annulohypoxylon truncatum]KAI1204190.1 hypothetical protein F4807DRAFT_358373 [Annulohypoxylon truncatum]